MIEHLNIRARDLPYQIKKERILSFIGKENLFHKELKKLLERIDPEAYIEILQGPEENGKDLVMRIKDKFNEYQNTAFVVKAIEKLSGSASGKTRELGMQVLQCFKIPAKLEDIYERVTISKVIVVNTGTISGGAKDKILEPILSNASLKNNVEFFDLERLIELFTEHYPEFFFNEELQTFFHERLEKIEKFLIEDKKLKYFIDPRIKKFEKTKKELIAQQNNQDAVKLIAEQLYGHSETFHSFLKLVTESKQKKIILTGDAGSGKSVLLYKIVLEFINLFLKENSLKLIEEQDNFSLPVCLKAIDLKNGVLDDLEKTIETFYSKTKDNTVKTIIIDGVDEISQECREIIKKRVEAYIELKDRNINIVFSSRTNFSILESFDDYIHYELMPYEARQAIEYIEKIAKKQSILVTNLEQSLRELEGQIPFYPLSLRLLVEVVEKHKEVPASITELYKKYIGIMFGEFDVSTDLDKLFEPRIKKEFFTYLSYEKFFLQNKVKINHDDYLEFVESFCNKHKFITDKKLFIENIARVSILKISEDEVYFSHKSFLDFFIAMFFQENKEELQEENKFDELFKLYSFIDQWEEVVFFYYGLKTKINKTDLKKLRSNIDVLEDQFDKNFSNFYLGRLIQYAWMTENTYKEEVISNAMNISLDLKENFHEMFKSSFEMEIPRILSSISMFQVIDLCYGSSFLRNETKQLIETNSLDSDGVVYFSTIYILKNSLLLGNDFVNDNLKRLIPKIQEMPELENRVLLTMLIVFFEKKGKIELDADLDKDISKLIYKYKKAFPDVFQRVLSVKKKDFKSLKSKLEKK